MIYPTIMKRIKGSKKIIAVIAVIFLAALVVSLFLLSVELQSVLDQEQKISYEEVVVEKFVNLDFSANCDVRIFQGREYKIELARDQAFISPTWGIINNTLYFYADTASATVQKIRITAPFLREINAGNASLIRMESFNTDSLDVVLKENAKFLSKENNIDYVSIKTLGASEIQLISDPMN